MLPAAVVVALAVAVRLAWVWLVPTRPVGDFAMYLESAAHVVQHSALDPEFVYMPGYVLLLSAVQAMGGGVTAVKVLGALFGGAGAGAAYGIAHHLWDRRVALVAGLLCAAWPAGIAVSSVTGTDLPAAVIIAFAGWLLVRFGGTRPLLAAAVFGAVMGVAAWIRAVAMPLAGVAAWHLRSRGATWRTVMGGTAIACAAAVLVLLPWAARNRLRYGETFFSDSHGGLTALVGANPNTEGAYSRSLNRMFLETTGYRLLAEPHRHADHAAYQLAQDWTAFSPTYAAGLLIKKTERLLDNERGLLYWPLYRAGVLPEPERGFFARWRRQIETVVDLFWYGLVAAGVAGLALAAYQRHWAALSFVPVQLALVGIYAIFFAEVRYHLPIALLLFPPAGAALVAGARTLSCIVRRRRFESQWRWGTLVAVAATVGLLASWRALLWAGEQLRARNRWAVHVCRIETRAQLCKWRPQGAGPSQVRGVWNGVGLSLAAGKAAATMQVPLPAGRYRVRATVDAAPSAVRSEASLHAARVAVAAVPTPMEATVVHPGGILALPFSVDGPAANTTVWLGDLAIELLP